MSFGSNINVSKPLFVMYKIARFHVNFNLSIIEFCAFLSKTLIITNPDISSMNGVSTFINFYSIGFKTICSFGKKKS